MATRAATGKRHSEKTKTYAVEMVRAGVRLDEVEKRTRASIGSIRRWAREAGIPPRPPKSERLFPDEARALAVEMHRLGENLDVIGAATGASKSTITGWAQQAGAPARRGGHHPKVSTAEVHRLYRKFKSQNVVADLLDCSRTTVKRHLQKGASA